MQRRIFQWLPAITLLMAALDLRAELKVSSRFESGSARVTALDTNTQTIRFQPAGDPHRGWQNWWFLRVDGAATNRPVNLELQTVTKISPAWSMPDRAALSFDGINWIQTGPGERRGNVKTYRVTSPSSTFWLAWGPPFTVSDAAVFCRETAARHPYATAFELCKSREGRSVPGLRIAEGVLPSGERIGIWIIAREHAWESGSSWVARGLAEWLVGADDGARWIRQNAEIFVVPIMDADRVATGDGGKGSLPQDHTFDWTETPHYAEVAAVQQRLRSMLKAGRTNLLLNLHNPGAGQRRQEVYLTPNNLVSAPVAQRQDRFMALLHEAFPGLVVADERPKSNDPADLKRWHAITTSWLLDQGNTNTIGFTIETPWNTPQSTVQGYGTVGRRLGRVMEKYLRGTPAKSP